MVITTTLHDREEYLCTQQHVYLFLILLIVLFLFISLSLNIYYFISLPPFFCGFLLLPKDSYISCVFIPHALQKTCPCFNNFAPQSPQYIIDLSAAALRFRISDLLIRTFPDIVVRVVSVDRIARNPPLVSCPLSALLKWLVLCSESDVMYPSLLVPFRMPPPVWFMVEWAPWRGEE